MRHLDMTCLNKLNNIADMLDHKLKNILARYSRISKYILDESSDTLSWRAHSVKYIVGSRPNVFPIANKFASTFNAFDTNFSTFRSIYRVGLPSICSFQL